jgi:riboflavin synthase alpha subunit
MFTGIVERTVRVAGVADGTGFRRLSLAVDWTDIALGQSVAVNGCCLTISAVADGVVSFDVIPETLSKTNLGLLNLGDRVNVERSLRAGDRLDGHFVQGHVDGRATLVDTIQERDEFRLRLELPAELAKYVIPKGSVSLDGVSLTVASLDGRTFEVALIPTTLQLTTLGDLARGWLYNFEADILAKTIVTWLERMQGAARG